jgi:glycosyltransferase involved in cell wall biosynthesis
MNNTHKPVVVAGLMQDEIDNIDKWMQCALSISDLGVVILDSGSTDGTIEKARGLGAVVVQDDVFKTEGGGAARNMLLALCKKHFHDAAWILMLDADERISREDFHRLRVVKDYLIADYDVVAFPRVDWKDKDMAEASNSIYAHPDWQMRMFRADSPAYFIRKLHEQIRGHRKAYVSLQTPAIHHFNQAATKEKRDYVGRVYAKLHREDTEWGHTYAKHPKEDYYYQRYLKDGV